MSWFFLSSAMLLVCQRDNGSMFWGEKTFKSVFVTDIFEKSLIFDIWKVLFKLNQVKRSCEARKTVKRAREINQHVSLFQCKQSFAVKPGHDTEGGEIYRKKLWRNINAQNSFCFNRWLKVESKNSFWIVWLCRDGKLQRANLRHPQTETCQNKKFSFLQFGNWKSKQKLVLKHDSISRQMRKHIVADCRRRCWNQIKMQISHSTLTLAQASRSSWQICSSKACKQNAQLRNQWEGKIILLSVAWVRNFKYLWEINEIKTCCKRGGN